SELRFPEIDGDTAEPREHRSSAERGRSALHLDPVEDRSERDLVALLVSAGRQHMLQDGSSGHEPGEGADGQKPEAAEQTHRERGYRRLASGKWKQSRSAPSSSRRSPTQSSSRSR